jgi:hypothetical protein
MSKSDTQCIRLDGGAGRDAPFSQIDDEPPDRA